MRDVSRPAAYDLVKIKNAIETEGGPFALFGGEPLLLPVKDLEDLWSWGFSRYGKNNVQTNGTLITDRHIELFRKYRVAVGISIDGPGALNDSRWHGTIERTRESTAKTQFAIERLCAENLHPGIILTLHRGNATSNKLPDLLEWVRNLFRLGVTQIRLHLLESENPEIRGSLGLSVEENIFALRAFLDLSDKLAEAQFDLFKDMKNLLLGNDRAVGCIWGACDPYTTRAVRGIEGHGERSNCGRTNKDGIEFEKAGRQGFERYVALYNTPQEHGGCQGCRFFLMCKGQCPGTAIDGDWRYRTEHCEVWKFMFKILEERLRCEGKQPLSLSFMRPEMERRALTTWCDGHHVSLSHLLDASTA